MSVLGNRLRETRNTKGWTQEVVANLIGTSKHVMSNWERGKANPDPEQIIALANAYEVSADFLLGLTSYPLQKNRDPFGIVSDSPTVNYSFIGEKTWDLPKLIDSGIALSMNGHAISPDDSQMIKSIIEITLNRIIELNRLVRE